MSAGVDLSALIPAARRLGIDPELITDTPTRASRRPGILLRLEHKPDPRSLSSAGYFLGAAMTLILRGLRASTTPGAVQMPIFPPDRIRRLPFGTGIVLLRPAPPIVTDLHPWPKRPDATQRTAYGAEIEALLRRTD